MTGISISHGFLFLKSPSVPPVINLCKNMSKSPFNHDKQPFNTHHGQSHQMLFLKWVNSFSFVKVQLLGVFHVNGPAYIKIANYGNENANAEDMALPFSICAAISRLRL